MNFMKNLYHVHRKMLSWFLCPLYISLQIRLPELYWWYLTRLTFVLLSLSINKIFLFEYISTHIDGGPRSPSAHAWPFAHPPISMSENFPPQVSAEWHSYFKLPSSAPVGNFTWNWAELALLSLFPTRPTRPTRPEKYQNSFLQQNCLSNNW